MSGLSKTTSSAEGAAFPPVRNSPLVSPLSPPYRLAHNAQLSGPVFTAQGADLSEGTVYRATTTPITIGHHSKIRENAVLISVPHHAVSIGRKVVIGHNTKVLGAKIGDLCDIGSAALLMPGCDIGNHCIIGEGALVPSDMVVPDGHVAVGRPARCLRPLSPKDWEMLACMRGHDMSLETNQFANLSLTDAPFSGPQTASERSQATGQCHPYQDIMPKIGAKTYLMPGADVIGDVVIGDGCLIAPGVRIAGDHHGPIRIGNNVQILENSVLHLLPGCTLSIGDDTIIGPGVVLHGCHIGQGCIIEPAAILCDNSILGDHCHVTAGSLIQQKRHYPDYSLLEGFPAQHKASLTGRRGRPDWAFHVSALQP